MGACSGTSALTAASGRFSDGPGDYANSLGCTWTIDTNGPTTLVFSKVALESNYDFVKVYEGLTTAGRLLQMLTGTAASESVTSASGQMTVVLTSDSSIAGSGFVATYNSAPASVLQSLTEVPGTLPPVGACSGTSALRAASGRFSDGPGDYANSLGCTWTIDTNGPTTLVFSKVALESNYDFVKVYEGLTTAGRLLQMLTGTAASESVTSASGQMTVVLTSDSSIAGSGFVATYNSAPAVRLSRTAYARCDRSLLRVLNDTRGTISDGMPTCESVCI